MTTFDQADQAGQADQAAREQPRQEYLVRLRVALPPDMPAEERTRNYAQQRARVDELSELGVIDRLWRLPGQMANVGIWSAPSTTDLHHALMSLPLWTYMTIDVEALATHPTVDGRATP